MKKYAYILMVLSGVLTAQCSKVTLEEICGHPSAPGGENNGGTGGEGEGNGDYNSYWYYSYEAAQLIDAQTLGMETAEDFTPYTVAHLGDTLFIANIGKAGNSLLLFSIKKGERLGALQSVAARRRGEEFRKSDRGHRSVGQPAVCGRTSVAHPCIPVARAVLPHLHRQRTMERPRVSGTGHDGKGRADFRTRQERNGQHL